MQSISFAVSVHHFISSVGADAGFAALVAVALLILLYFSHARETATLRKRADEAELRAQALEGQLAALADHVAALPAEISVHAVNSRTAPAYGGAHVPAGVGAAAPGLPPAAPAGVGAPALAAATRLIPDPVRPVGQPAPAPATVGLVDRPDDGGNAVPGPPPVTVGGNGSSVRPVAASAATIQRAARPATGGPSRPGSGPPRTAQGRPPGAQGRRPGGPPPAAMALRTAPRRTRAGTVLAVLAALLGVGAVVAGVLIVTNLHHSSSSSKSVATNTAASHRTTTRLPAVVPSTVTVSVLNGTDTSELARTVSNKLDGSGYKKGYVGNYGNSQTKTSSVVEYMRGDKRDAAAVAAALKLPPTAVQPIDTTTQQIACPPANGPCTSAVVVTVGSDLAGLATATQ